MNNTCNSSSSHSARNQSCLRSIAALVWAGVLLAGCGTVSVSEQTYLGSAYQPKNIFRQSATLPESLRRVAVLPLTTAASDAASEAGRGDLEATLRREAIRIAMLADEPHRAILILDR